MSIAKKNCKDNLTFNMKNINMISSQYKLHCSIFILWKKMKKPLFNVFIKKRK